jgi:hypothetical protein
LPRRLNRLAALRRMLTSWTNSVERTSIPFSTLPASAPASAALAMLAVRLQPIPHPPQISLDFKGVPFDFRRYTRSIRQRSRAKAEQSYGSFGACRIIFGSGGIRQHQAAIEVTERRDEPLVPTRWANERTLYAFWTHKFINGEPTDC